MALMVRPTAVCFDFFEYTYWNWDYNHSIRFVFVFETLMTSEGNISVILRCHRIRIRWFGPGNKKEGSHFIECQWHYAMYRLDKDWKWSESIGMDWNLSPILGKSRSKVYRIEHGIFTRENQRVSVFWVLIESYQFLNEWSSRWTTKKMENQQIKSPWLRTIFENILIEKKGRVPKGFLSQSYEAETKTETHT